MLNKEKRSVDEKEAINSIRFLAKSRKLWAIALALVIVLLVVGAVCIADGNLGASTSSITTQPIAQSEAAQGLSLEEISEVATEYCPDFTLSIVAQAGEEYYRLDAKDDAVYLLLNAAQTELVLYSGSQSLTIPCITVFGNATEAPAVLAMQDLTGDGTEEFIFLHETGGTGALGTIAHVIHPITLEEYPLPDMVKGIALQVEVQPSEVVFTAEGDCYVQCAVSGQLAGQVDQSFVVLVQPFAQQMNETEMSDFSNFAYDPAAQNGGWVEICLLENGLQATVGLQIENQVPWEYVANATAMLTYDVDTATFVVGNLQRVADSTTSAASEMNVGVNCSSNIVTAGAAG